MQLSTPAPNTITQSLTATGTIQWAAGSLFYLPEGLLVEAVFVSEGEAVQEGDKIAALRREDVEQKCAVYPADIIGSRLLNMIRGTLSLYGIFTIGKRHVPFGRST